MRPAHVWVGLLGLGLAGVRPAHAAPLDESAIQCIECHVDVADEHVALIDEWRTSVHYSEGITCGQCHGMSDTDFDALPDPGEGAHRKPDAAQTLDMCARCHQEYLDYYPLSAHFQKERLSCVMCHGGSDNNHHAIHRATRDLITEDLCTRCHTYDRAEQTKAALRAAEDAEVGLDGAIAALAASGYHSTRIDALHEAAQELQKRVPQELHTFQLRRIQAVTQSLVDIETNVAGEKERIMAKLVVQARRQRVGFFIVLSCFGLSALLLAYRQTYVEEWRDRYGPPGPDETGGEKQGTTDEHG